MDYKNDRIGSLQRGENPMLIKELKGSYVVMGDTQFLPGYCVVLPKVEVSSLNDLTLEQRSQFLLDMSIVGDVLLEVTDAMRINYSILGNSDKFLHAHVFPRFSHEAANLINMPVWHYPKQCWYDDKYFYNDDQHLDLKNQIFEKLTQIYVD